MIYCKLHLTLGTKIIIHENVKSFVRDLLERLLGCTYDIFHVLVPPADCGVPGISRPRGYDVPISREKVEVMGSPLEMYKARAMISELCMSVCAMLRHFAKRKTRHSLLV